jgi:rubrerythrin
MPYSSNRFRRFAASLIQQNSDQILEIIRERELEEYKGEKVICMVCQEQFSSFAPEYSITQNPQKENDVSYVVHQKESNTRCPACGSLQRHRLLWKYLHDHTDLFDGRPKHLLEVAPERRF